MFTNLAGLEIFFLICAVVGGIFVFIRLVTQFIGGGDADIGADVHVEASVDVDAHHADSDIGFKFLSMHGLTSFFMMFGLVGFAMHRQSGAGAVASILAAMAAGFASVWIIGKLFAAVGKLQSSGTIPLKSAIGSKGTVYLTIPAGGTGKVMVEVRDRVREYSAVAKSGAEMKTGVLVTVVSVNGDLLVVDKNSVSS